MMQIPNLQADFSGNYSTCISKFFETLFVIIFLVSSLAFGLIFASPPISHQVSLKSAYKISLPKIQKGQLMKLI